VDKTDTVLIRRSVANLELQVKDLARNGGVFFATGLRILVELQNIKTT
jgi:hypothetical protein